MIRATLTAAAACLLATACESPVARSIAPGEANRITNGSLTGDTHRGVLLLVMDIAGKPAFRCSGALLTPTVLLTAGHCAGEPGEFSGMRVFTEADVDNGNNNYPNAGPNTVEAKAWHSHPQFTEAQFYLHDVGVVELTKAINLPASEYGALPTANQFDALKANHGTGFTAVGYGAQKITSAFEIADRVRMIAQPWLLEVNGPRTGTFSLLLSNNASSGGICFGDSGGPNYLGTSNVIAGTSSFVSGKNCVGGGGVFRLDKKDVLDFIKQYLP